MSALVIKEWTVSSKVIDEKNNFVRITGREGGLIAWILSLMGIDPTTTIQVGLERIEFSSASLAGTQSRMIPLQGVCSSYYGYHKPWKAAASIIGMFLLLGTFISSAGGPSGASLLSALAGLVIATLYYFLNRTLTLGFVEHSGAVCGIQFKRSVIENVDIDQDQAKTVCVLIQRLIEAKEKRAHLGAKN